MESLKLGFLIACFVSANLFFLAAQDITTIQHGKYTFQLPKEYLEERDSLPSFWINTNEELETFLDNNIKKGEVEIIGISAGGRPIKAISYGTPRKWKGTTTFSGALGFRDMKAYRGPDHDKKVCLIISGVHGGEFEGIVGTINLLSIVETGKDLRGKEWPEITEQIKNIDRLILVPIANPDGRARVPVQLQKFRGDNRNVHEFLNTGGKPDGQITGWPEIKEFIPMDFNNPGFPGGYPNDAGVNIMHDDFFGEVQPETEALFNICEREKPDITLNMHTGARYMMVLRPFSELVLQPVFDSLYNGVLTRWTNEGFLSTNDVEREADPVRAQGSQTFNLTSALNLHCGTLCVTVESPSHGYGRTSNTPDFLLDAHLYCYLETIQFLVNSGGRSQW
jgi:hypothetical protein